MKQVDVFVHYTNTWGIPRKVATLSMEENLVFKDEGDNFKALVITAAKFSIITAASPLIAIVRLVRSVAFAYIGDLQRGVREFIGGLAVPFVAGYCLMNSLLSCAIYPIDSRQISISVQMRRTYAYFEAWINDFSLQNAKLASYSHRVSSPTDFIGCESKFQKRVWTTAPCIQPVFENGYSSRGGILDLERLKKIFPLIKINGARLEGDKLMLLSEYDDKHKYKDEHKHVLLCGGACERESRRSLVCCDCFLIETAYTRVFCIEVGEGNCISTADPLQNCGFVFCKAGCLGVCCCTENGNLVSVGIGAAR